MSAISHLLNPPKPHKRFGRIIHEGKNEGGERIYEHEKNGKKEDILRYLVAVKGEALVSQIALAVGIKSRSHCRRLADELVIERKAITFLRDGRLILYRAVQPG